MDESIPGMWSVTIDLFSYEPVDGYDHVLVMADGFTRGVELVATKGTPTSAQVLDILFHRVIRGHRVTPRIIGAMCSSRVNHDYHDPHHVT